MMKNTDQQDESPRKNIRIFQLVIGFVVGVFGILNMFSAMMNVLMLALSSGLLAGAVLKKPSGSRDGAIVFVVALVIFALGVALMYFIAVALTQA